MPRATLKAKSNDGLVALSEAHPDAVFEVLGAWPDEEELRLLVETDALGVDPLTETLGTISDVTDLEVRHAGSDRVLLEVTTTTPEPHGAMADSGIVPSFPLHLEDGWLVGDLVASQDQLSAFRDELDSAAIEYRITQVSATPAEPPLLTDRQREVVAVALERGYYESPRDCTLTALAEHLGVNKSAVSRVLHRAEGKIVTAYASAEVERTGRYAPGPRHVVSRLTERQREVLEVAIDLGYYREPREATHDEIAAATGLSETTAGEHLRKIEATVFSSLHVGASDR